MNPRHKNRPAWADSELSRPTVPQAAQEKPSGISTALQEVETQDIVARDAMSDLEWMKSHMSEIRDGKDFEQSDGEDNGGDIQVVNDGTKVNDFVLSAFYYVLTCIFFSLSACRRFI